MATRKRTGSTTKRSAKSKAKPKSGRASSALRRKMRPQIASAFRFGPELEAELAITIMRGTVLADDGEYAHLDWHWDKPKRHGDYPPSHWDKTWDSHEDTSYPHQDSDGVGPGPKQPKPKKPGPHTDTNAGHLDYPPMHFDYPKGHHEDSNSTHYDEMMPATSEHTDRFVGHQDEGDDGNHNDVRA